MFLDDILGRPSSSSSSSSSSNSRNNKGKHHNLTDEEYIIYNTFDDENVPLEFFTETSGKPQPQTEAEVIDLENETVQDDYIFISDNESRASDVVLVSDEELDNNSNSINNNGNNDRNNDGSLSEDELLALRLQLEEEEEYNNRMSQLSHLNPLPELYDTDDYQLHSLYSTLSDAFQSPVFMNSRGYVMDLRNYVEDEELDDSYEGLLRLEERIGNVKHNLNTTQINKNKTLKYNKNNKEIQETECSICLFGYEKGDELRKLICSHTFHKECIDNWFKSSSTCPICRTDIKDKLKN